MWYVHVEITRPDYKRPRVESHIIHVSTRDAAIAERDLLYDQFIHEFDERHEEDSDPTAWRANRTRAEIDELVFEMHYSDAYMAMPPFHATIARVVDATRKRKHAETTDD